MNEPVNANPTVRRTPTIAANVITGQRGLEVLIDRWDAYTGELTSIRLTPEEAEHLTLDLASCLTVIDGEATG